MANKSKSDAPDAAVSMDERIDKAKGLKAGDDVGVAAVQSVTDSLPADSPGSKEIGPTAPDVEPEVPPLHTGKPDTPIAQVLAAGAGEHTPPDPSVFGPDGRPIEKGEEA